MTDRRRVVGLIQARMRSTRLPGKVLLPLAGAPLLQRLVERVGRAERLDALVVATGDGAADDKIAALCADLGVACHRGSESDVLGRMLEAGDAAGGDILVRLTADNPLVGGDLVDFVLDAFLPACPPYVYAQTVDETGFPYGLFVEAMTTAALRESAASTDPEDREHVTLCLRRQPERFPALAVKAPGRFTATHVSIDTGAEYERVKELFETFYARDPAFGFRALMRDDSAVV